MKRTQAGFTMIELVIVIVILGILAATALPRFVDLAGDARGAKADAALGAVKSAANLAHATQLAKGLSSSSSITMEGKTVTMINSYPTADTNGIMNALSIDTTTDKYTTGGSPGALATSSIDIQVNGAATIANCYARYAATAAGSSPTYSIDKSGC